MFGEFLNIIVKSIKLDKTLYSDNKNFAEASIYFAGIIMILDGIAGAVAAAEGVDPGKVKAELLGRIAIIIGCANAKAIRRRAAPRGHYRLQTRAILGMVAHTNELT